MYARFLTQPAHPRALLFMLEGLALWCGQRSSIVIYADKPVHPLLGLGRKGEQWPGDNPLLEFHHCEPWRLRAEQDGGASR